MKKLNFARAVSIVLLLVMVCSLAACGGTQKKSDAEPIIIYDGTFSEMQVIYQMVKLLVEEHTDLTVEIKDQMSSVLVFQTMINGGTDGGADIMNTYDGTVLTTFLHQDTVDIPEGMTLYEYANEQVSEQYDVHMLGMLGLDDSYAFAVRQETADEYGLETISDLAEVAENLVFAAEHDFFSEEGSAKFGPISEFYGLDFKKANQIDINLKYSAIASGNADVIVAYTTDGLNKKANLKFLLDDRSYFPEYNDALLVRNDLFERYKDAAPNLEEVLEKLTGIFTNDDMVDLTYQIDVEAKDPTEVAKEFLKSHGLIA